MDTSKHLGPRLRLLNQQIHQYMDQRFAALDLTGSQSFFLRYLTENDEVYPKDLEQRFHLSHPTVSGILQRLESKGFITMEASEHDRRCKRIRPTEKAIVRQKEVCKSFAAMEQVMVQEMSEEDIQTLIRLLDMAAENLKKTEQEEPNLCSND